MVVSGCVILWFKSLLASPKATCNAKYVVSHDADRLPSAMTYEAHRGT